MGVNGDARQQWRKWPARQQGGSCGVPVAEKRMEVREPMSRRRRPSRIGATRLPPAVATEEEKARVGKAARAVGSMLAVPCGQALVDGEGSGFFFFWGGGGGGGGGGGAEMAASMLRMTASPGAAHCPYVPLGAWHPPLLRPPPRQRSASTHRPSAPLGACRHSAHRPPPLHFHPPLLRFHPAARHRSAHHSTSTRCPFAPPTTLRRRLPFAV